MNPKLTLYPLGNADSCLIELTDGRLLLMDFSATRGDDPEDLRIDLPSALREDLGTRRDVDVLAISHLDEDHYGGVSDLFYLDHAAKYQDEDRIKIRELWVPAAVIVEEALDATEAKVIRAEARYRLKEGKGIRVYSRPEALEEWLNKQGLKLRDRAHLITDAGCLVPGFSYASGGVEMFVHSPFAESASDGRAIVRNSSSLALQATFKVGDRLTRVLLAADLHHEDLAGIVRVTRAHANDERLEYDVVKLPHHCSYLSLAPEKGTTSTQPVPEVEWLYQNQGQSRALLVSSSDPIPPGDTTDPPHRQAAKYYARVANRLRGEFAVTMEHPKQSAPDRLIIEVGNLGASLKKSSTVGAPLLSRAAPRAG